MTIIIIIEILLLATIIAAGVIIGREIKNKLKDLTKLNNQINTANNHLSNLQIKENDLNSILSVIGTTIKEAQIQAAACTAEKDAAIQELHEAQSALVAVQAQLKEGRQETANYEHLKGRLRELEDRVAAAQERVQILTVDEASKKEILTAMKNEESQLSKMISGLKTEVGVWRVELDHVKESYRQAIGLIGGADGSVRHVETFHLTGSQEKLLGLLDEVVGLYPELREALMTVAWKKVWLPEIQRITKALGVDGAVSGIYRLSWVKDEKVCYIGQAVKVAERWYTHIKKMIGVEAKGNERLYAMVSRPDEVSWEVVEIWDGQGEKSKWLDEREKWWIETTGAKEIGWNKK